MKTPDSNRVCCSWTVPRDPEEAAIQDKDPKWGSEGSERYSGATRQGTQRMLSTSTLEARPTPLAHYRLALRPTAGQKKKMQARESSNAYLIDLLFQGKVLENTTYSQDRERRNTKEHLPVSGLNPVRTKRCWEDQGGCFLSPRKVTHKSEGETGGCLPGMQREKSRPALEEADGLLPQLVSSYLVQQRGGERGPSLCDGQGCSQK